MAPRSVARLSNLLDHALIDASAGFGTRGGWALVALGSYARRELCPGSDVDVMLLHTGGRRTSALREDASRLWYPLWDAGFVLGHSARTVKEALSLADSELDALTALLDTRLLAGDDELLDDMMAKVRRLAPKRRNRLIDDLAAGAAERQRQPGPIAEMLAPNLKDGGGGLRDVQAPGWVGWALGPDPGGPGATPGSGGWSTGVATLVALGYLRDEDRTRLREARDRLLDARVALASRDRRDGRTCSRCRTRTPSPASSMPTMPTRSSGSWASRHVRSSGSRPTSGRGCSHSGTVPAAARAACAALGDGIVVRDDRIALELGRGGRRVARARARGARGGAGSGDRSRLARSGRRPRRGGVDARGARRVHRRAGGRARCDPRVRSARSRGRAGAAAPGMGARAGAAATQRVPPLHRRPSLARGGRRVGGDPCLRRARRRGRAPHACRT